MTLAQNVTGRPRRLDLPNLIRLGALAVVAGTAAASAFAVVLPARAEEPAAPNTPPVAVDDYFEIPYETGKTLYPCANDTDAEGDPIGAALVGNVVGGTIVGGNGTFCSYDFVPDPGFSGVASFAYVAMDRSDWTVQSAEPATVTIMVGEPPAQPANTLPVAAPDTASTLVNTQLTLTHAALTANDVDTDGDTLEASVLGVVGPALFGEDWHSDPTGIRYTPPKDFVGTRTLTLSISDGTGAVTSLLTVEVMPALVPADPIDPVDPTDPVDPIDPVDPADPTEPADPGSPADPTVPLEGLPAAPGVPAPPAGQGASDGATPEATDAAPAAVTPRMLAATGADAAGPLVAAAVLALAGTIAMTLARLRRAER